MTTGLTYSQYVTQVATLAVVAEDDPAFVSILPQMITQAENRIYRELNLLSTSTSTTAYQIAANSRTITVPMGTFVTTEQINLLSPAGSTDPNTSTRVPLLPTTKEYLDAVWGNATSTGIPKFYCAFNDNVFLLGPYSDATYTVEIIGTYRPESLSASNTTTFISTYLPDLFVAASMVYASLYQRNFTGANANDPQMGPSWEMQYQALFKSAATEEARKAYEAAAWSSQAPATAATPTRG
jgi:hypothetical protein